VHRLRIASRRVDAALRLFEPLLPPRRTERLRRRIRKVRRAAGAVRDVDVLIDRLPRDAAPDVDVLPLMADLRDRRSSRANELLDRIRPQRIGRIRRQSRKVLERVRWRDDGDTQVVNGDGLRLLQPALDEFRSAAGADLSEVADLHRFRKCAKRLRYSVELLIPGESEAGGPLQSLRTALEGLQDQLGRINDHAAATTLLSEIAGSGGDAHAVAAAGAQLAAEQREFDAERDRFLAWWHDGGAESLLGQFP
jgi:CHAD domain-containing protein